MHGSARPFSRLQSTQNPSPSGEGRSKEAPLPTRRRFSEENLETQQQTRARDVGPGSSLHSEGCGDQDGRPFIVLAALDVVREGNSSSEMFAIVRRRATRKYSQKNRAFKKFAELRTLARFVFRCRGSVSASLQK